MNIGTVWANVRQKARAAVCKGMEEAKRQSMNKCYGADDRNGCKGQNGNKTAAKVCKGTKARRASLLHTHKNEHAPKYRLHTKQHTHEYTYLHIRYIERTLNIKL